MRVPSISSQLLPDPICLVSFGFPFPLSTPPNSPTQKARRICFEADEGGEAYGCLQQLLPWWPVLKRPDELGAGGRGGFLESKRGWGVERGGGVGGGRVWDEVLGFLENPRASRI